MSFEADLGRAESLYIIPRGCKDTREIIRVVSYHNTRFLVYFPENDYQVITDDTLKERETDIQTYIEQTERGNKLRK